MIKAKSFVLVHVDLPMLDTVMKVVQDNPNGVYLIDWGPVKEEEPVVKKKHRRSKSNAQPTQDDMYGDYLKTLPAGTTVPLNAARAWFKKQGWPETSATSVISRLARKGKVVTRTALGIYKVV